MTCSSHFRRSFISLEAFLCTFMENLLNCCFALNLFWEMRADTRVGSCCSDERTRMFFPSHGHVTYGVHARLSPPAYSWKGGKCGSGVSLLNPDVFSLSSILMHERRVIEFQPDTNHNQDFLLHFF